MGFRYTTDVQQADLADVSTTAFQIDGTNNVVVSGMLANSGLQSPDQELTLYFEYATNSGFTGSTLTPAEPFTIYGPAEDVPFGVTLSGLTPGATYWVRAVAINEAGRVDADPLSFTVGAMAVGFEVTATSSPAEGGSVTPATRAVVSGETTTLFAQASPGYTRLDAVGGTCPVGSWDGNTYTTGVITEACTVHLTFSNIYTLTVTGGTGGGEYAIATVAAIAANLPGAGQYFTQWTGTGAGHVTNANLPNTTVTMPAANIGVAANYAARGATTYSLTVNQGSGSGAYLPGIWVAVAADAPAAGSYFTGWTGDTAHLENTNLPDTRVYMPASPIAITATFAEQGETTYPLTVTGGTGDGSYLPGTWVDIAANAPAEGQVFHQWIGATGHLVNPALSSTRIFMPASAAGVTASYRAQGETGYQLTVTGGTGDGNHLPGAIIAIEATPVPGFSFVQWVGQTATIADVRAPATTLTMPFADAGVAAFFIASGDPPPPPPAPQPVSGACGIAHGGLYTTLPEQGLCNTGYAGAVSGTGPWNWRCTGFDGGATVTCGAYVKTVIYATHVPGTDGWTTEIAVMNNGDVSAFGTLYLKDRQGVNQSACAVSLTAGQRVRFVAGVDSCLPRIDGYAVLESSSEDVVGYTQFIHADRLRGAVPMVRDTSHSRLYVPHIASQADQWGTGIALLNTTDTPKTLTLVFNDGQTRQIELDPAQRKAFLVRALFEGQPQPQLASAVITGAAGVTGMQTFSGDTHPRMGAVTLSDATADRLIFPHLASDPMWWTGIAVYNPSDQISHLTIHCYDGDGLLLDTVHPDPLAPGGKLVGMADLLGLDEQTEWFEVVASVPVTGLTVFGTWNGAQLGAFSVVEATAHEGVFPKLEPDGWTGIALVNSEAQPALVSFKALTDNGTVIASTSLTVPGFGKLAGMATSFFAPVDIGEATHIRFSSDRRIVGFQLNGSSDGGMLDALPVLGRVIEAQ